MRVIITILQTFVFSCLKVCYIEAHNLRSIYAKNVYGML